MTIKCHKMICLTGGQSAHGCTSPLALCFLPPTPVIFSHRKHLGVGAWARCDPGGNGTVLLWWRWCGWPVRWRRRCWWTTAGGSCCGCFWEDVSVSSKASCGWDGRRSVTLTWACGRVWPCFVYSVTLLQFRGESPVRMQQAAVSENRNDQCAWWDFLLRAIVWNPILAFVLMDQKSEMHFIFVFWNASTRTNTFGFFFILPLFKNEFTKYKTWTKMTNYNDTNRLIVTVTKMSTKIQFTNACLWHWKSWGLLPLRSSTFRPVGWYPNFKTDTK